MLKVAFALVVLVGVAFVVSGADDESGKPSLIRFDPVQIRGDLKVTLIEVSRSTLFTKNHVRARVLERDGDVADTYAVPALEVAFVIERIGKKPIKSHVGFSDGMRIFRNGKRIEEIEGVVPGGVSTRLEYVAAPARFSGGLPKVRNPKLANIRHHMLAGIVVRDGDDIRIEFGTGYGEERETFSFDHVPVR